jgi:hypothetical protein
LRPSGGIWRLDLASRAGAARLGARAQSGIVLLLAACLLCLPAFYNGHPFLFSDLLEYVGDGMRIVRKQWPGGIHPPFYSVAIWPLHLETSLWPVVIVQGLIVSHLLSTVLRVLGVGLRGLAFLAAVAGLAILTSLSWYVSHVMPDIFSGVLVLALFLLAFGTARLTLSEKVYCNVLATLCLTFHLSFVPIGISILVLAVAFRLFGRSLRPRPMPSLALLPLLFAAAMSAYVSHRFWGNLSGPPYAPPYLLGHVLVDGPGKEYLSRACATETYVLCAHQDEIPGDVEEFMFNQYSPFRSSGQQKEVRAESRAVILGTLEMFPLRTVASLVKQGLVQIVTFNTQVLQLDEISDGDGGSQAEIFEDVYPFIGKPFEHTKQSRGLLSPARLQLMNDTHWLIVVASAAFGVYALIRSLRTRNVLFVRFLAVVCAGVLVNDLVTGMAVGPFGRFGARIIWLVPFAAVAGALTLWYAPRRRAAVLRPPL